MFLFFTFFCSSTKSENRRAEQVLPRGRKFGTGGRGCGGERGWRINMGQIIYTPISKCKNDTC
jgi:hypothetical protein